MSLQGGCCLIMKKIRTSLRRIRGRCFLEMPCGYNVAVIGPRLSGKKTYARLLADKYNWVVVDVEKIVGEVLIKQKAREKHISSNPDPKN